MAAVAAVAIGVVPPHQIGVALAQILAGRIGLQSEQLEVFAILAGQRLAVAALLRNRFPKARRDGVERIGKVGPARTHVRRCGKGAGLPVPAGIRPLRLLDLVRAHAFEEIIAVVERAHMIEAEPLPLARPVEAIAPPLRYRRTKFAGLCAAGMGAGFLAINTTMQARGVPPPFSLLFLIHSHYIGRMSMSSTGPVAQEITRRLTEAFAPSHLAVIDDSEKHRGHAGHDARGESHFTVEIVSGSFASQSRVARQRAINRALSDLLAERVHALAIKARAPGEA